MSKTERKIIEFIGNHAILIAYIAVTITAMLLRLDIYYFESGDYSGCLHPWIEQLRNNGGLKGVGSEVGEYNVPYMFFLSILSTTKVRWVGAIKNFSVLFDYVGAFAVVGIVSKLSKKPFLSMVGLIGYSTFLLNPNVFLNSALWAQCDSIYSSFVMLCILFMLKEKYPLAMFFYGVAFSFKLQAIFFFPVIIVFYFVSKKMSAKHMLLIILAYIVLIIPALVNGRSLKSTLSIYTKQTDLYEVLACGYPNVYWWFSGNYEAFKKMGVMLTISIIGVCSAIYIHKHKFISQKGFIILSLWITFSCTLFLPSMHDRYAFVPCILSVIWTIIYRKDWCIALIVNFTSFMGYCLYLFEKEYIDFNYLAIANFVAFILITKRLFLCNDYDDEEFTESNKSNENVSKRKTLKELMLNSIAKSLQNIAKSLQK